MKLKASAAAIGLMACGVLSAQTIEVQLGEKAGTIELNVNDAARSLLEQMPLKLKFEDFGSAERIAYLPQKLKLGSSPTSCAPSEGDLTYYIPWGNLAVFVKGWRPSNDLVPLGKLSDQALEIIKSSSNRTIEIKAVRSK